MQTEHRKLIQQNFSSLVEQTDLDLMVASLYEKGVFSSEMIEPYKDTSKDTRTRKRLLYMDITRRGPEAFNNLLDSLSENGYWDLVRCLDSNSYLHTNSTRPGPTKSGSEGYISVSEKKRKSGKEQQDPNRNWPGQSTSQGFPDRRPDKSDIEKNGNPTVATVQVEHVRTKSDPLNEVPKFNVIKSTKFFEDNEQGIKLYRTRGRQRGVLVLFTYSQYQADLDEFRQGAELDALNLRYLFSELGFKPLSYLNLTLKETQEALCQLKAGHLGSGPEVVVVVFSSHGYQRANSSDSDMRCYDGGLISFYEIIDYFNNENFPKLQGVPKLFIFQACRGTKKVMSVGPPRHLRPPAVDGATSSNQDMISGLQCDGTPVPPDACGAPAACYSGSRRYSDILIAHSTVPGYVSNRDPVKGSWFIQVLCEVFASRAHDTHVEDLLKMVDARLGEQFGAQTASFDQWGFSRRLYLHPGLYED